MRVRISDLENDKVCTISGLVDKVRDTKYMLFVVVKDNSNHIQVSIEKKDNQELVNSLLDLIL